LLWARERERGDAAGVVAVFEAQDEAARRSAQVTTRRPTSSRSSEWRDRGVEFTGGAGAAVDESFLVPVVVEVEAHRSTRATSFRRNEAGWVVARMIVADDHPLFVEAVTAPWGQRESRLSGLRSAATRCSAL